MNDLELNNNSFETIKHIDENRGKFWYARELMVVLEYRQWRRFESVIDKAKQACQNSGINVFYHFANVGKMIKMPKGAEKNITDYIITRYVIRDAGGTMTEDLPTPRKSLKQLKKEKKKELKNKE